MSAAVAHRRRRELKLQLQGLVAVRALLELRGASPDELAAHEHEAERIRTELAQTAA